nr:MAG TPA: major inner protein [Caudoviricetes sp.]
MLAQVGSTKYKAYKTLAQETRLQPLEISSTKIQD